jgi:hypothetical protein
MIQVIFFILPAQHLFPLIEFLSAAAAADVVNMAAPFPRLSKEH